MRRGGAGADEKSGPGAFGIGGSGWEKRTLKSGLGVNELQIGLRMGF